MNVTNEFTRTLASTAQLFAMACMLTAPGFASGQDATASSADWSDPFLQSLMNNCKRTVDPEQVIPNFSNALMDCTQGGNPANPLCFGKGCISRVLRNNGCMECAYDDSLSWLSSGCDPISPGLSFLLTWIETSKPCVYIRDGYSGGDCECNQNPANERGPVFRAKRCQGAVCDQTCTF